MTWMSNYTSLYIVDVITYPWTKFDVGLSNPIDVRFYVMVNCTDGWSLLGVE